MVRNWVGKLFTDRITITAPVANNAANVIFTVTGKEKALALKGVLEGPYEPEQLPSQLIQPDNGNFTVARRSKPQAACFLTEFENKQETHMATSASTGKIETYLGAKAESLSRL